MSIEVSQNTQYSYSVYFDLPELQQLENIGITLGIDKTELLKRLMEGGLALYIRLAERSYKDGERSTQANSSEVEQN